MSRTHRHTYLGKPAREGEYCRKCPDPDCNICGQGKAKRGHRRRERHRKTAAILEQHEPWLIEVEQDPTAINAIFEAHGITEIPEYTPGQWVGVDLETMQPIILDTTRSWDQITHPRTPLTD